MCNVGVKVFIYDERYGFEILRFTLGRTFYAAHIFLVIVNHNFFGPEIFLVRHLFKYFLNIFVNKIYLCNVVIMKIII